MVAVLAVLLAALCFGTTGTAQALAGVDASPFAVGAARILIGGGMLGLIALATRKRANARADAAPARLTRETAILVAVGAVGVLAYQPAFFLGTRTNGVAIGTVVALGSAPVITGVLDALIRRRRPTMGWALATALAVIGVALVGGLVGGDAAVAIDPLGLAASVGAGASYAAYALTSKALLDRGWRSLDAMGALFGTAAVVSVPVLLVAGTAWLLTPAGLALALWLGVVTTAIAYALFGWGLSRLTAPTVATLTLAEPLTATLLGIGLLGERLTVSATVGLVVLASALVLVALSSRVKKQPEFSR
ncbi:DME family drug/metabolite transporter [Microbacterium endophyticum]|uniref:DME family drug/metabolite transporter n=1 Tax=Microbacterium endophyticum TaxID=1526412 RepID=A0A7W4V304_9MICO|nr:EamA family transporter [Microbacterium endophyticum]MBB2975228.1 DME family drug/metabolite transporter [Microbacterium endophyticum]NIK37560.1 DME family drug/metabolite transporter [Microbacterium endophyticum]